MNFLKKYSTEFTIVLALTIAFFPDLFKKIGEIFVHWLLNNGTTNNLLITMSLMLLHICRECWVIKKMNKKQNDISK